MSVPLTAVVNRERDEHGQTHDWVLVSTSNDFTAATSDLPTNSAPRSRSGTGSTSAFGTSLACTPVPSPWWLTRRYSCCLLTPWFKLTSSCASAGTHARRLGTCLATSLAHAGSRSGVLSLAVLFAHAGGIGRILLDIDEPARGQLREKLRRIEREQYSLLENARAP